MDNYNAPQGAPQGENNPQQGFNQQMNPQNGGYNQYQQYQPQIMPQTGFIEAIRLYFKNYANFSGRSRRSEYWFATLFVFLVNLVLNITGSGILQSVVTVAFILPNLALQARRLHDIGRTGKWIFANIASGFIAVFIVFYFIIYAVFNIPQIESELNLQGVDISALYPLYPILNIPMYVIGILAILILAISIMFLVFNCTDSQKGPNKYGQSPKYPM